ncbi:MAG: DNA repair protein RecO [Actinobacteria bacterium]|nr:DNA repair protein RecO [Actinomycetota bacterium]
MQARYIKTEGIILSVQPYLESDSILRILSKELGLIPAIARGARKSTSKRSGVIQPFNKARFELYSGRNFYTVVQAQNIAPYAMVSDSYIKALTLMFASEVVLRTHEEGQMIRNAYELLDAFFAISMKIKDESIFVYLTGFLISYLRIIGYQMQIYSCRHCGRRIQDSVDGTLLETGEFECSECGENEIRNLKEIKAALKTSAFIERRAGIPSTHNEAINFKDVNILDKNSLLHLLKTAVSYLRANTEIEFKSFDAILKAIETEG